MSYLEAPRLTFSGRFQADVSTVNNDVRHFDSSAFEPRFQGRQTINDAGGTTMNGWWNPEGSGAFRLIDVRVASAETVSGPQVSDAALGLFINAQIERVAAKLVDLDPQFQMGSEIWGLRLLLSDGEREFLRGDFRPTAFRDIYFGRVNAARGSGMASARFTSVLENVIWSQNAASSPTLSLLQHSTEVNGGRLSVSLTTYAYNTAADDPAFTYGRVIGAIGPWAKDEPRSFVLGRRFAPANPANPFATPDGVGCFDAVLVRQAAFLDLGNALPLASRDGAVKDLGSLTLVVLKQPDRIEGGAGWRRVIPSTTEGAAITPEQYLVIGEIDYRRSGWLAETSGIVTLSLPPDAAAASRERPLGLVAINEATGARRLVIREAYGGLHLRAEDFERRIDARFDGAASDTVLLYAAQYGVRAPHTAIIARLNAPEADQGGSGPQPIDQPQAPIPLIGVPQDRVRFPTTVHTNADGVARLPIQALDPGNPRGYIDGQIYKINYSFGIDGESAPPLFDQIVLHVRDAFVAPDRPSWEGDIAQVMRQYGNLYPIMSKGLFSFSNLAAVEAHVRLLHFAFTRPSEDPNHMPVTRDLSAAKRGMIVAWLESFFAPPMAATAAMSIAAAELAEPFAPATVTAGRKLTPDAAALMGSLIEDEEGIGKSAVLRAYLESHRDKPA